MIQSGQNFAYGIIAELSCHMQICDLTGPTVKVGAQRIFTTFGGRAHNTFMKRVPGYTSHHVLPDIVYYSSQLHM